MEPIDDRRARPLVDKGGGAEARAIIDSTRGASPAVKKEIVGIRTESAGVTEFAARCAYRVPVVVLDHFLRVVA
jgi:hypothetical protein